jgi:hypothetical protein
MPPSPTGSSPPARPSRDALSALNQSFFRSLCRPPLPRSARVLTRGGEEDGKDGYRAGRTPDGLAEPSPTIRGVLPGSGRRPWPFTAVHRYVIAAEAGGCKVTYTEDLTRLEGAPRMLRTPGVPRIMFPGQRQVPAPRLRWRPHPWPRNGPEPRPRQTRAEGSEAVTHDPEQQPAAWPLRPPWTGLALRSAGEGSWC